MPRKMLPLLLFMACTGRDAGVRTEPELSEGPAPAVLPTEGAPGWGAVFWRAAGPTMMGEGTTLVGPFSVGGGPSSAPGDCGGVLVENAPKHAVLAAPAGAKPEPAARPPVVPATLVEAAAWRLDETLPARDGFAPLDPDAAPPRQRGVEVGSVIKQRRKGGPPVVLAVGARECTAAAVLLDHDGGAVLDSLVVPGVCGPVKALPLSELDGQPGLETAMYDDEAVVLLRLRTTSATAALEALGIWRCPRPAAPTGAAP